LIYINDIDDSVCTNLLKFADGSKLFSLVFNVDDIGKLQRDLTNLCNWAEEWMMLFNVEICKMMHIGRTNNNTTYEMN